MHMHLTDCMRACGVRCMCVRAAQMLQQEMLHMHPSDIDDVEKFMEVLTRFRLTAEEIQNKLARVQRRAPRRPRPIPPPRQSVVSPRST
jgi:hypothetical protein